jgi:hypothetical protein
VADPVLYSGRDDHRVAMLRVQGGPSRRDLAAAVHDDEHLLDLVRVQRHRLVGLHLVNQDGERGRAGLGADE